MINLLPQQEKKLLKKEFFLRLTIVAILLMSGSVVVGSVFMVPWYVAERTAQRLHEEVQPRTGDAEDSTTLDPRGVLSRANTLARVLREDLAVRSVGEAMHQALAVLPSNVEITALTWNTDQEGKSTLTLNGVGARRNDVQAYRDALRASDAFESVTLPFPDLAPKTNLEFTVTLQSLSPQEPADVRELSSANDLPYDEE